MNILITGASGGIGKEVAKRFLELGHTVYGLDIAPPSVEHSAYHHFTVDVKDRDALPDIPEVSVLFLNAGTQLSEDDIGNNLVGSMNVVEKYTRDNPTLTSVLFNASASAISGQEFPEYVASKAGLVGYMKHLAIRLAPLGVTCNAISLGGVETPLNAPVMNDPALWQRIMDVTPMKKWMTCDEVADWVIFLTLTNRSMSGQNLLIDNGEHDLNSTFVWPNA